MILMFIGPSSSGKDFFYRKATKKYNLKEITLYTTRPKRNGEIDGREYFFISDKEMDELDVNNNLVERRDYNTKHGIWSYATRGDDIDYIKDNYIVINTWEGYQKYIEYFGMDNVIPIYIDVNYNTRIERAIKREMKQENPKYNELRRRFIFDRVDFKREYIEKYNPIIIDNNKTKEYALKQLYDNLDEIFNVKKYNKK